jgi:hypothetical protein
MPKSLSALIADLRDFKRRHPSADKATIEAHFSAHSSTTKARSVYVGSDFSFRFSEANTGSFSNVVLSLSALMKYDTNPFIICIVRPTRLDFLLANSTFLKRISHSSHTLRLDNIRGSFLGHDIIEDYEGVPNTPENFEKLFALHSEFSWQENVERLVETTNSIIARSTRFEVNSANFAIIMSAPERAAAAAATESFKRAELSLLAVVENRRRDLLQSAAIDDVNLRGNNIENIITGEVNAHRLDDIIFPLEPAGRLVVDIKTKLLDRASAPKAYNIDKMLRLLAETDVTFAFFFIGITVSRDLVQAHLVSIFDPIIVDATRIQTHWAGRSSRGVTQLTGDLSKVFLPGYRPSVDIAGGKSLLTRLIER